MKQRPRIAPKPAYGYKKRCILAHAHSIPDKYKPFFRRPRWDTKHQILRGSDGYAIGYLDERSKFGPVRWGLAGRPPATWIYQLTTDQGDRGVYYRPVHIRLIS